VEANDDRSLRCGPEALRAQKPRLFFRAGHNSATPITFADITNHPVDIKHEEQNVLSFALVSDNEKRRVAVVNENDAVRRATFRSRSQSFAYVCEIRLDDWFALEN